MKAVAAALLLLLAAQPSRGEERFHHPAAEASTADVVRGIPFGPSGKFDLYRPAAGGPAPVVVFVNSTGAPYRDWAIYQGWGKVVASRGLAAVVYQPAASDPRGGFDALIAELRAGSERLRIDPSRVVLWCGSTNVTLGVPLAMEEARPYLRGLVVAYGSGEPDRIRPDLPVYVVKAGLDATGLNERLDRMVARAREANAPWIVENYGNGYHGFEVTNGDALSAAVVDRMVAFMHSVTRPSVAAAYAGAALDVSLGAAFSRGDWAAAVDGYRRKITVEPGDAEAQRRYGLALLETRQYREALHAFERAWELGRRGVRDTAVPAARAAAGAGDVEGTLRWLDVAMATPFGPSLDELRTSDDWGGVRSDPRFQSALEKWSTPGR